MLFSHPGTEAYPSKHATGAEQEVSPTKGLGTIMFKIDLEHEGEVSPRCHCSVLHCKAFLQGRQNETLEQTEGNLSAFKCFSFGLNMFPLLLGCICRAPVGSSLVRIFS